MVVNEVTQLISQVGFPVVASMGLFWLNYKTSEFYNASISEMRKSIDQNTLVIDNLLVELKKLDTTSSKGVEVADVQLQKQGE